MIYECSKCNKLFNQKSHYENHLRRKNPYKPLMLIENKIETNINDINTKSTQNCGFSVDHTTKLTQFCGKFLGTDQLDNIHPEPNNLKCKYCKKIYTRKDALTRHFKNGCNDILKEAYPKYKYIDITNDLNETLYREYQL